MESVVEVGSLRGRSAYALLTGCSGPVYCIDPWDDEYKQSYPAFMENCGHFPNLRAVQGFSPAVASGIPDVDMIFIDGAHDEISVTADIKGWWPKTKKIICGHDYVPGGSFPDVAIVVDRIFGNRVKVAENTAIWYVEV
jgi:precorrin-6B methylase 2